MNFQKLLEKYDYNFPKELIAQAPAFPRDSARLLVYKKQINKIHWDVFKNINKYLPPKSVLVFNKTKVLPARLTVKKQTGGSAKILYLGTRGNRLKFLSNKKLAIGNKIYLSPRTFFIVDDKNGKEYLLKSSFKIKNICKILEKYGEAPLPPYIKNTPLSRKQIKKEYQTVFARIPGSVAAPTASLHFTKKLLEKIRKSGHDVKFITLHVNLGTFAPLSEENIKTGLLHEEHFEIGKKTADFINKAKKEKRPIIAVGTTTTRTLESAVNKDGALKTLSGKTRLFIRKGYNFKITNGLITNFHVPKSSLLMLVAAFTSRKKVLELYEKAIVKKFRFFSFGDGMFIY